MKFDLWRSGDFCEAIAELVKAGRFKEGGEFSGTFDLAEFIQAVQMQLAIIAATRRPFNPRKPWAELDRTARRLMRFPAEEIRELVFTGEAGDFLDQCKRAAFGREGDAK